MKQALRRALRPLYRAFVRAPGIKQIIRRELAQWGYYCILDFVEGEYGRAYGLTKRDRIKLVDCFQRNTREIESGTSAVIHTMLAREILSLPPGIEGDVIECGAWKGASSASLSLICRLVGCRLIVCDSFQGLPDDGMQLHTAPHARIYGYYREGMFCGSLVEVRSNIEKYGDIEVCDFVPGFFSESLRTLSKALRFAFLDVDLVSSTRDCLRYIWPLLSEGGAVYTDDALDMDIVRVFFDEAWWRDNLHCAAPGYVGSGCGLPLGPPYSSIGYTRKLSTVDTATWQRAPHLYYPDK
jgi:hypothetical protein